MSARTRVILGTVRPTLTFEWPTGRPAAAPTVALYHPDYADDAQPTFFGAQGTATLSAIDTTVGATAAAGASSFTVAARADITPATRLWITTAAARKTQVEVQSVTAGAGSTGTIAIVAPLPFALASGDKVQSAVCTYQLASALDTYWADDGYLAEGYRLTWTSGGDVHYSYFDLVRQEFRHGFTTALYYRYFPDARLMQSRLEKGDNFAKQVDAAADEVEYDLRVQGINPDSLRGADVILPHLMLWRLGANLAATGNVKPPGRDAREWAAYLEGKYAAKLSAAVEGKLAVGVSLDTDGDGAGDAEMSAVLTVGAW